jgi:hypothetical protein
LKDMPWLLEQKAERNDCQCTGTRGVGWEPKKRNDVVFDGERSNKRQPSRNILLVGLSYLRLDVFECDCRCCCRRCVRTLLGYF